MGKSNAVRRVRSCLKSVHELLREYGCTNTETLREAVTRLIGEHREAVERARLSEKGIFLARESAELAIKTRTGAQALATKNHEEARALRRENEQLRSEIEEQRRRIMSYADQSNPIVRCVENMTAEQGASILRLLEKDQAHGDELAPDEKESMR